MNKTPPPEPDMPMKTMEEVDALGSKYPLIVRAIYFMGVPAVLSFVLVWFNTTTVETKLSQIEATLNAHQIDSQYNLKSNTEQIEKLDKIYQTILAMCINQANQGTIDSRSVRLSRCFGDMP